MLWKPVMFVHKQKNSLQLGFVSCVPCWEDTKDVSAVAWTKVKNGQCQKVHPCFLTSHFLLHLQLCWQEILRLSQNIPDYQKLHTKELGPRTSWRRTAFLPWQEVVKICILPASSLRSFLNQWLFVERRGDSLQLWMLNTVTLSASFSPETNSWWHDGKQPSPAGLLQGSDSKMRWWTTCLLKNTFQIDFLTRTSL